MRWAAWCVVHVYSAGSLVALSRSDEDVMTMVSMILDILVFDYSFENAHVQNCSLTYLELRICSSL